MNTPHAGFAERERRRLLIHIGTTSAHGHRRCGTHDQLSARVVGSDRAAVGRTQSRHDVVGSDRQSVAARDLHIPGVVQRIDHHIACLGRIGDPVDRHLDVLASQQLESDVARDDRRSVHRRLRFDHHGQVHIDGQRSRPAHVARLVHDLGHIRMHRAVRQTFRQDKGPTRTADCRRSQQRRAFVDSNGFTRHQRSAQSTLEQRRTVIGRGACSEITLACAHVVGVLDGRCRCRCHRVHAQRECRRHSTFGATVADHHGRVAVRLTVHQSVYSIGPARARGVHRCVAQQGSALIDAHGFACGNALAQRSVQHGCRVVRRGARCVVVHQRADVVGVADDGRRSLWRTGVHREAERVRHACRARIARLVNHKGCELVGRIGQAIQLVCPAGAHDCGCSHHHAVLVDLDRVTRVQAVLQRALEQRCRIVRRRVGGHRRVLRTAHVVRIAVDRDIDSGCRGIHRERERVGQRADIASRIHHLGHILVCGRISQTAERQSPAVVSRIHRCSADQHAVGTDDAVHKQLFVSADRLSQRTVEHRSSVVGDGRIAEVVLQRALIVGVADDGRRACRSIRVFGQCEHARGQAFVARSVHDHGCVAVSARGQSLELVSPVAACDGRHAQQRAAFVDAHHIIRDEARHRALEQRRRIVRGCATHEVAVVWSDVVFVCRNRDLVDRRAFGCLGIELHQSLRAGWVAQLVRHVRRHRHRAFVQRAEIHSSCSPHVVADGRRRIDAVGAISECHGHDLSIGDVGGRTAHHHRGHFLGVDDVVAFDRCIQPDAGHRRIDAVQVRYRLGRGIAHLIGKGGRHLQCLVRIGRQRLAREIHGPGRTGNSGRLAPAVEIHDHRGAHCIVRQAGQRARDGHGAELRLAVAHDVVCRHRVHCQAQIRHIGSRRIHVNGEHGRLVTRLQIGVDHLSRVVVRTAVLQTAEVVGPGRSSHRGVAQQHSIQEDLHMLVVLQRCTERTVEHRIHIVRR